MKKLQRLLAAVLAVAMIMAMSMAAFAGDEDETTTDGYAYEIYQIFIGDFFDNILSNVKWGENAKRPEGTAVGDLVSEDVLTELKALNSSGKTDTEKLKIIEKYVDITSGTYSAGQPKVSGEGDSKTYTYSDLPDGYYLIKDKDNSVEGNDFYTTYVARVTGGELTFTRKGEVPTTTKKIDEGDLKEVNEASIGDTVKYKITGTLPSNLGDYKTYYYVFNDTLSKGLTFTENSVKVVIYENNTDTVGVDVTRYFYVGAEENETGTALTIGIENLLRLNNSATEGENPILTLSKDSIIVVTYKAVLNENAKVAGNGNENTVELTYSNNPNDSGDGDTTPPPDNPDKPEPKHPTGTTPSSEVVTYTTELTIIKVDGERERLTGAEFTLAGNGVNTVVITGEIYVENENGTYYKLKDGTYTETAPKTAEDETDNTEDYVSVTVKYAKENKVTVQHENSGTESKVSAFVNDDGKVIFTGLGAGNYTLTETVTPKGYNTIEPINFTIGFEYNSTEKKATFSVSDVSPGDSVSSNGNILSATIENNTGSELPSTGGMGTTLFYIIGAVLVIGAGVLLVVRRFMNSEK